MKLDATLGGIAALMLAGTFCTFALCMVEDVNDGIISPEYYYTEVTEGDLLEDAVAEQDEYSEAEAVPDNGNEEEAFDEEADILTDLPEDTDDEEELITAVLTTEAYDGNDEENYPEDYDVDEYDDSTAEVREQTVYAEVTRKDSKLYADENEDGDDDKEIFDSEEDKASASEEDQESVWTDPVFWDDPQDDDNSDIVITLFDPGESSAPQPDISVNVENNSGISTSETFTANFNGSVQTVNAYDLICWIVNNEVSAGFSDEAIKAQAVAAYSYVKYHNVNGLTPTVLVKKDPPQRIKDLVSSVWGVCCYYNGKVAQTVYMASSSGYTADAKNVWGGSFPYLKSVACPFDAERDPNYGLTMAVTEDTMRSYLEKALNITLSDDPENWMTVTAHVDGNYVSAVNIDGQTAISGRQMREKVFSYKLKSTAFDISYSNGIFTFTTYGYGHGVGMSQNGANILAKQGYSYSEILKHYFTGIEVL